MLHRDARTSHSRSIQLRQETVNQVHNWLTSPRVVPGSEASGAPSASLGLGSALRRAWIGYQLLMDRAMAEAGFGERRFPDGRVLRICSGVAGTTVSAIGREIGVTRQGATKVVADLRDRGFVAVADSTTSKREKSVVLTPRGVDYLALQGAAARSIEDQLRDELGESAFSALSTLLDTLDAGEDVRLRAYLRRASSI